MGNGCLEGVACAPELNKADTDFLKRSTYCFPKAFLFPFYFFLTNSLRRKTISLNTSPQDTIESSSLRDDYYCPDSDNINGFLENTFDECR